jgi:glycyl-tRNA synthetase alpha subunit
VRAYLTVMDRNPEAVEKAFTNKPWVAQALLPVRKADASRYYENKNRSVVWLRLRRAALPIRRVCK